MLLSEKRAFNLKYLAENKALYEHNMLLVHTPFTPESVREVAVHQMEVYRQLLASEQEIEKRLYREYRALMRRVGAQQLNLGWGKIY
jgi:hypothetical protein